MAKESDLPPGTVKVDAWRGFDAVGQPVSAMGIEKWVKKAAPTLDISNSGAVSIGGMRLARDSKSAREAGWEDVAAMLEKFEGMTPAEQLQQFVQEAGSIKPQINTKGEQEKKH